MTLYTLGYIGSYRRFMSWARCHGQPVIKCVGGFAFPTAEAARRWVIGNGGLYDRGPEFYGVFAMEDAPTTIPPGGDYPILVREARIIGEVLV